MWCQTLDTLGVTVCDRFLSSIVFLYSGHHLYTYTSSLHWSLFRNVKNAVALYVLMFLLQNIKQRHMNVYKAIDTI